MKNPVITVLAVSFLLMIMVPVWGNPKASVEWQTTSIDMGEIDYKKPVTVEFLFTNPGMVPLIITNVESSCGCTVADFPKEPIISGKSGKIKVTYDADTEGQFSKTITVHSNASAEVTKLYIRGIVVK